MKSLIVKNSWFSTRDSRLDASFHLSNGRLARLKINKSPYKLIPLNDLASKIFNGPRFRRIYVLKQENGIPFMGSADMLKTDLNNLKRISKKNSKRLEDLLIEKDWILVSCSGTIGKTVYTNEEHQNIAASQHIMRIVPNGRVLSGFLFAFLSSKYGYALLTHGKYGAVIQHIEPHHIEEIPVPMFSNKGQLEIHNLIAEASKLRADANEQFRNLVNYLEIEMNQIIGQSKFQSYSKLNIRDLLDFEKRFDGQYNTSIGRAINDKIILTDHKLLKDISEIFHPILFGKKQIKGTEKKGNPLFKSSSMVKWKPETDFWLSLRKVDSYKKLQVKEGWVLVSRTGTVGSVVRIGETMNETFIDDHMIRVKPREGFGGIVYAYLKSFHGQRLIEFQKYGSVQEVINSDYIERIPIPTVLLQPRLVEEYFLKVKSLSSMIDIAFNKEKHAISLIEEEIESWQEY